MNQKIKNHGLAFFTIFIWGITFISTKYLEKSFTALEILFIRYVMAYIVCWIICPRPLKFTGLKYEGMLLLASVSGSSLYQYLENLSVANRGATTTSKYLFIMPLITLAAQAIYDSSGIGFAALFGMLITLIGIGISEFQTKKQLI